jgi:hypothetical protein
MLLDAGAVAEIQQEIQYKVVIDVKTSARLL